MFRKLLSYFAIFLLSTGYVLAQPPGEGPGEEDDELVICVKRGVVTCPTPPHGRCNEISPGSNPFFTIENGPAGAFTTVVCASFVYNNCPSGEMQSTEVNMDPAYISLDPDNVPGATYVVDSTPEPKVCYFNEPCRENPEVSTIDDPLACVNCMVEDEEGALSTPFPEDLYGSTCAKKHWCVGAADPPPSMIQDKKLAYEILSPHPECEFLWGS
ncbi:MAG TPA: hypothetical protein DDW52_30355 [Planctomycetaceae bacterium]|nr:hypothetical protein [Planctomycetaceae bacterium]